MALVFRNGISLFIKSCGCRMFPWCSSVSLLNDVVSLKKNQGNLPKYLIRVEKQLCEKSQMGPQFQPHPRKPSYCPSRESSLGIVPEHH